METETRLFALCVLGLAACGPLYDPSSSIQINFNLYASDELGHFGGDAGACAARPVALDDTTSQKQSGLLELDPFLNPNGQYLLNLQVSNQAAAGDSAADFHPQKAVIRYIDIEGNLSGMADNAGVDAPSDVAFLSGDVAAGSAAVVQVLAASANEVIPWTDSFETNSNLGPGGVEHVVLETQITGVSANGSTVTSSAFDFPLTLCFGCNGLPIAAVDGGFEILFQPNCPALETPIKVGVGPCCSPQDFHVACEPCGNEGTACCAGVECAALSCTGPSLVEEACETIPFNLQPTASCVVGS